MRSKLSWTNNELEDLVRQLNLALEASGIGIWQHNLRKNQTRWDEQLQKMYGVPKGEHDVVWLTSVHPDDCENASKIFETAIANRSSYASQFRIIRPGGEIRHLRSRAQYFIDAQGEPCFVGAEWDVTEDIVRAQLLAQEREAADRSRAESKYAADHDHLTGLLNRRAFDEAFAALASGCSAIASLCHIDIDHFKDINDRFGHAGGDAVLRHVGALLSAAADGTEIAARLGGDEFAVLSNSPEASRLEAVVEDFRSKLRRPLLIDGEFVEVECSIGLARAAGAQIQTLLGSSDIALYEAKKRGRNRTHLYSPALAKKLAAEKQQLYDLKAGLQRGEIVPFYQVQVDAKTHRICGLEALARWESPNGLRTPAQFLELAKANGLLEAIDDAVLRQVLFDIGRWAMADLIVPRVSVNISAERLSDPHLVEKIRELKVPTAWLGFELIETIFFDTLSEQIKRNIDDIRDCGIEIEIDDLGSGHASLLGLIQLRPNRVKIDRHLIKPLLENDTQRRLIGSLIEIARTLDTEVVAEGVETMEHARVLAELGTDILQGYAFGRPEPASAIPHRLSRTNSTHRWKLAS